MLDLVKVGHSYEPDTVAAMAAAFDLVSQSLSAGANDNNDARRALALIILRHVDRGERDSARLAEAAFREFAGTDLDAVAKAEEE
jgi:hypothetical protein